MKTTLKKKKLKIIHDFKTYCEVTEIKTVHCSQENAQWNIIKTPDIDSHLPR